MNVPHWSLLFLFALFAIAFKPENENIKKLAAQSLETQKKIPTINAALINRDGQTINTRFRLPDGFQRVQSPENSFTTYLQTLPLKPHDTKVKYYNGATKEATGVYAAVIDMDIGKRDLQQCADAIMRLRAEYLWAQEKYEDIHFNFTNGFQVTYQKWMDGYRMKVKGNKTNWYKAKAPSNTYKDFRSYMNLIFAYAGTLSLSKELPTAAFDAMKIGDIFIQGGSPGHAVIVVDMAINPETGKQLFLLAQSYMPAQDIQILQNPMNESFSPWYSNQFFGDLITPEWRFERTDLKRFE